MAERILVTGATGKVGNELVRGLADSGVEVRAATRSPARARELFGADVDVVELDFVATETYDAAVQWVDRMFLMPPPFDPDAFATLNPFLDWAVQAGVGTIVLLSAMTAEQVDYLALRKLEKHIETLGVRWTFLRPNLYMQNFAGRLGMATDTVVALPAGAAEVSFVDVRDVADVASAALSNDAHAGIAYTLTGPEGLRLERAASILAEASGRPVRYEAVAEERFRERLRTDGWREPQIEMVTGLFRTIREGRRAAVTGDIERVLGRPPRSLRDYARDWAAALGGSATRASPA